MTSLRHGATPRGHVAALAPVVLWNLAVIVPIWLDAWGVFAVMALYWFENFCVGAAQYRKLRDLERFGGGADGAFSARALFALHYGLFTAVHGVLVFVFFGLIEGGLWEPHGGWWISVVVIAAVQLVDYHVQWRARAGWTQASAGRLMIEPYARVAVLHAVVIVGGWLALSSSQPRSTLIVFATVKLVAELVATILSFCSREAAASAARG